MVGIAGIWALATLAPWSEAESASSRPSKKAEVQADSFEGILASQDVTSKIRALARSTRPEAALELAVLSSSPAVTADARILVKVIRAMARFERDVATTQALLRHLRVPPTGDDIELRSTARSAAALALARGATPVGLRALVLFASGPVESDPGLASLARSALAAYPPTDDQLADALPWLDARERRVRVQAADLQGQLRSDRRKAACSNARRMLSAVPQLTTHAAAQVLDDLAHCPPGGEPDVRAWTALADESETWAFRGLAATGKLLDDPSWTARANAALRAEDPTVRSAAAWFLSLKSSEMAVRLVRDRRAEVRAAARNQLAVNAGGDSDQACGGSRHESTSTLFERYTSIRGDADPRLLGCLASRLRSTPGPGLTTTDLEALFTASSARARVSLAHGLRAVATDMRPQAAGLAERLYASEGDGYVRRFLCTTLQALDQDARPTLSRDLELDADPVCRAIGRGKPLDVASSRSLSTIATGPRFFAARVLSPPLALEPAPDGFVGARVTRQGGGGTVGLEFVDCSESGEATWACGQTSQTPG